MEPDFHAMKRQYQKGALQAGHQLSHSQILPVIPHYVSQFSPLPSWHRPQRRALWVLQQGRKAEMGRNLGRQNESWAARNGARCLGPVQELQARGATKWGGDGLWEAELGTSESWKTGRFLDFAEKKNNVHNYKAQDLAEDSCLSAGMGWREWRSQESEGLSAPCSLHTT